MTSEANSALLPVNVDRRPPLHVNRGVVLYNKSLNYWSVGKTLILFPSNLNASGTLRLSGNKINCFPRDQQLSVYHHAVIFLAITVHFWPRSQFFLHYTPKFLAAMIFDRSAFLQSRLPKTWCNGTKIFTWVVSGCSCHWLVLPWCY